MRYYIKERMNEYAGMNQNRNVKWNIVHIIYLQREMNFFQLRRMKCRRIVLLIIHYSIDLRGLRDNNKIYMTMNKIFLI